MMRQRSSILLRAAAAVVFVSLGLFGGHLYAGTLPRGGTSAGTTVAIVGAVVVLAGLAGLVRLLIVWRADTRRRCPMCAERVKAAARVCRYCGHKFAD